MAFVALLRSRVGRLPCGLDTMRIEVLYILHDVGIREFHYDSYLSFIHLLI